MAEYIAMEDAATDVRTWHPALVPGLLQTPAYVRAVCVASEDWTDPDEIEPIVAVRMKRQDRLRHDVPLRLHALISEAVLRQQVGGPEVMRQQLNHLRPLLGSIRLDKLTVADVTLWWASYVEEGGRDVRTGMGHVEALNRVVADAIFHGLDVSNPVPEARRRIKAAQADFLDALSSHLGETASRRGTP